MYLPELRVLFLCFFIFLSGCEIRRVDSVSAYAETLTTQESDIADPEVLTVSPTDDLITSESQRNTNRGFLGIRVTPREEEQRFLFSAKELPGLSEYDVRLYSKKYTIAKDLVDNIESHDPSCEGTDFNMVLNFRNTVALANQGTRLNRAEDAMLWKDELDRQANMKDEPELPPLPDIEDPLYLREQDHLLLVDENFARFRVTSFRPQHFQFIQISALEDRNATLLVDAMGRVTTGENTPRVFYAHNIELMYFFTQNNRGKWRCAHLHASYNPITINERFQSDYDECQYERGGLFGIGKKRAVARCKARVIREYERIDAKIPSSLSDTPDTASP